MLAQFSEAGLSALAGDVLRLAIEGKVVGFEGCRAGGGGVRAEVVLGEGDGEGGVGGEVEDGVAFAPVSAAEVSWCIERCWVEVQTDLITAMLTGAKVLARCTSLGEPMVDCCLLHRGLGGERRGV